MRIACVLIPRFPLAVEVRGRPELRGLPLVLGGAPAERKVVVECSAQAEWEGIRRGMSLREALARCRTATFLEAHPAAAAEIFARMLDALERVSPLVEAADPGRAFVDLRGLGHGRLPSVAGTGHRAWGLGGDGAACDVWGAVCDPSQAPSPKPQAHELQLAAQMQTAVRDAIGMTPRVGIADGRFAALRAAMPGQSGVLGLGAWGLGEAERIGPTEEMRCAGGRCENHPTTDHGQTPPAGCQAPSPKPQALNTIHIVPPGEDAPFLSPLPVRVLPLSEEMLRRLGLLGVRTVGELAALPRPALAAQFGPEGARAWDLIRGELEGPLLPRRQPPEVAERLELAQPAVEMAAILAAVRHLLGRLLRRPECLGRAARGVALDAELANGHRWGRALTFREPTADRERMLRALAAKLGDAALPAPVARLALSLRELCGESGVQARLFAGQGGEGPSLDGALDQLRARFGKQLVQKIVGVEPWSRFPERQYALIDYEPSTSLGR